MTSGRIKREEDFAFGKNRPTLYIQAEDVPHFATMFWFHGLGDISYGWEPPLRQMAAAIPGLRIVAPTAPAIPQSFAGGQAMPSWCDVDLQGINPMQMMQTFAKRPARMEGGWVDILGLVTKELEKFPGVPLSRMVFGGYSLGAHAAAWTALQLPQPPAGLMMWSGVLLGIPAMQLRCPNLPILHCHGNQDQTIPALAATLTKSSLQQVGLKSEYEIKMYPMGHESCEEEMRDGLGFLRRVLKPDQGPLARDAEEFLFGKELTLPLTICSNGYSLPPGTRVVIKVLKSKPHLNGSPAVVESFSARSGRYTVRVGEDGGAEGNSPNGPGGGEGSPSPVGAGGEVLGLLPTAFWLRSLAAQSSSGDSIELVVSGGESGELLVNQARPDDGPVDCDKVRIATGAVVRLRGLQGAAPWNGSWGVVRSFSESTGRYTVDLGNQCQLSLKSANLFL